MVSNVIEPSLTYWQKNLEGYASFYGSKSFENFEISGIFGSLYKTLIFPLERRTLKKKYHLVEDYIRQNVKPGMMVVDLGCGTGVFTIKALKTGAKVISVDFNPDALILTQHKILEECPEYYDNARLLQLDITKSAIPKSDLVLAIGILPWIESSVIFMKHVLPFTNELLFNYLDATHWINYIRRIFPRLMVRPMKYDAPGEITKIIKEYGYQRHYKTRFSSNVLLGIQHKQA